MRTPADSVCHSSKVEVHDFASCMGQNRRAGMGHTSEVKDHIRRERKLIGPRPLVIGPAVPGMIEPYLRPYLHCRPHPVAQHQRGLAVLRRIPRPLALLVIQEVSTERREIVRRKLLVDVVHHRPLRRQTRLHARPAIRAVCTFFRRNRTGHTWHISLVHRIHLRRHMPGASELVIPGAVIHLQIVERILAVIDSVCRHGHTNGVQGKSRTGDFG